MRKSLVLCMCFCSVVLAAQQPGQRFPNRPRIFPRNQERQNQADRPGQADSQQERPLPPGAQEMSMIDSNGDGEDSEQEIHAAVQRFLDQSRERNPQRFKKAMQRFDADKDQQISRSEALAIYKDFTERMRQGHPGEDVRREEPRGEMSPKPPDIDLDRDGVISGQEIYAAIQANINDARVRNPQHYNMLMQRFDVDKDQAISFEEAMEMHREHEQRRQQVMQQGMGPRPGEIPGERQVSDNGLLKGIKIEGLNIGSGL